MFALAVVEPCSYPTFLLREGAFVVSQSNPGVRNMGIIAWLVVGLIGGFIGSKIVNKSGEGLVRDIILGVVGALVGGEIFQLLGYSGVSGIDLWSILVAVIGSIVVLVVYHALIGSARTA